MLGFGLAENQANRGVRVGAGGWVGAGWRGVGSGLMGVDIGSVWLGAFFRNKAGIATKVKRKKKLEQSDGSGGR